MHLLHAASGSDPADVAPGRHTRFGVTQIFNETGIDPPASIRYFICDDRRGMSRDGPDGSIADAPARNAGASGRDRWRDQWL
jgi:hypothetical protein